eukprot:TRINITY_DN28085_c0_g1_i1.p1 TRINITY_DN28085_c0_g1~~TRINITY_DN28085_c0_g1_i1.p1  ORF type:complete len:276 (+),score=32.79 TRINITY_DN28085_c0_g1_i1:81-908(+)
MKRPAATTSRKQVLKRPAAADGVEARNRRGRAAGIAKIKAAAKRGTQIINHGAGTMPIDAPAPFGGTRYTILRDPPGAKIRHVAAHTGKRDSDGSLKFHDAPEFRPTLTPEQCLRAGIFGGCYFNPRGGKPGIFAREVAVSHKEFPKKWFKGLTESMYVSRRYYIPTNKYGVKSGQDQAFWESKGWIHEQDPRGWFQWYCRFFQGRRSLDDARQIKRWAACASEHGRWRGQLCGRIHKERKAYNDPKVAPVIRQTLLHWAYELTKSDWENWKARM